MTDYKSLSHTRWECKYHVVFIPKYRKKAIYGQLRRELGEVLRRLAERRESRIEEGHLMSDHVHMMISIPPKYSPQRSASTLTCTVIRDRRPPTFDAGRLREEVDDIPGKDRLVKLHRLVLHLAAFVT